MKLTMLNNILIPERVQNYYLLPQTIIGIELERQVINATKITYAGNNISLDGIYHQPIELQGAEIWQDRAIEALKKLAHSCKPYDKIRISIPSSQLVFKKLIVPFSERSKIAQIINYELEPYLPFPLTQAVITFTIISTDEAQGTTIFAAAAPRTLIEEYNTIADAAGLPNASLSVDLFDLYSLYHAIPEYQNNTSSTVLIALNAQSTRMLYVHNGLLDNVRVINKGISWFGKELANKLNITPQEAIEKFLRFGFSATNDPAYMQALRAVSDPYFSEINFTLQSFAHQGSTIEQCLIAGSIQQIPHALAAWHEYLGMSCQNFSIDTLIKQHVLTISAHISHDILDISSISTAFITPLNQSALLALENESIAALSLFKKQVIVGGSLLLMTFIMLFVHNWREKSRLRQTAVESESQIVRALKQEDLATAKNASRALNEAQDKVVDQEEIWFAFSKQTRISFLKYLERLSIAIDRVGIGLKLDRLAFMHRDSDLVLVLQGQVKNFDALKILEQELRESNLFVYVPSFQTKTFNEEIPLKKNGEEL